MWSPRRAHHHHDTTLAQAPSAPMQAWDTDFFSADRIGQFHAAGGSIICNALLHVDLSHLPVSGGLVPDNAKQVALSVRAVTKQLLPFVRDLLPDALLLDEAQVAQAQSAYYHLLLRDGPHGADDVQREANDPAYGTTSQFARFPELAIASAAQTIADRSTPPRGEISGAMSRYLAISWLALHPRLNTTSTAVA